MSSPGRRGGRQLALAPASILGRRRDRSRPEEPLALLSQVAERSREENEAETEHREEDADDIERVVAPQFREIERNDRGRDRKPSNAHFARSQKVHMSPVRLVSVDPLLRSSFKDEPGEPRSY